MSRLNELIQQYCPDGVAYKRLKDVCSDFIVPMRDRPKVFDGDIPWCRIEDKQGQFFNGSLSGLGVSEKVIKQMNLKVFPTGTVICSCSASLGTYAINTRPLITNQTFIGIVCGECLFNKYLLYFMETQTSKLISLSNSGTIPYVSRKKFEELEIPVPPLPVQEEIVRILDTLTELQAELQAELQKRLQQYNYYRDKLLSFNNLNGGGYAVSVEWKKLGEIGKVCMCKRILKEQTSSTGDIPFFKIGTFGGSADAYISKELFDEYVKKYSYPKKGDILISAAGTIGRTVVFDGSPSYFQDSNIVWLKHDESVVLNSYLRYIYSLNPWAVSTGGTIARLYNDNILNAVIPVPPLAEQQRIVDILDRFSTLTTDITAGLPAEIEARRKQYEYYRDQLLTFKQKA